MDVVRRGVERARTGRRGREGRGSTITVCLPSRWRSPTACGCGGRGAATDSASENLLSLRPDAAPIRPCGPRRVAVCATSAQGVRLHRLSVSPTRSRTTSARSGGRTGERRCACSWTRCSASRGGRQVARAGMGRVPGRAGRHPRRRPRGPHYRVPEIETPRGGGVRRLSASAADDAEHADPWIHLQHLRHLRWPLQSPRAESREAANRLHIHGPSARSSTLTIIDAATRARGGKYSRSASRREYTDRDILAVHEIIADAITRVPARRVHRGVIICAARSPDNGSARGCGMPCRTCRRRQSRRAGHGVQLGLVVDRDADVVDIIDAQIEDCRRSAST